MPWEDLGRDTDVRSVAPIASLVAIGKDMGGDFFFIDARNEDPIVWRFVHDEGLVARMHARTLGAHVAAIVATPTGRRASDWSQRTRPLFLDIGRTRRRIPPLAIDRKAPDPVAKIAKLRKASKARPPPVRLSTPTSSSTHAFI